LSGRGSRTRLRRAARVILEEALGAAEPSHLVASQLRVRRGALEAAGVRVPMGRGRIVVVAAGKAAVPMARAAEGALGRHLSEGIAVTSAGAGALERVRVRLASHPVPDARGLAAAREFQELASALDRDDVLLVLLSGGASALLPAPAEGLTLDDLQRTTGALLRGGATIQELNAVRKHLSRLKGGGLVRAAAPARVVTLVLSDVVGDDLSTIASGPTVPDPTTYADALAVLARRARPVDVPKAVRDHLEAGVRGSGDARSSRRGEGRARGDAQRQRRPRQPPPETPKPGDGIFHRATTRVVGSTRLSVAAAAREARRLGLRPVVLTTRLEGEAREAARVLVAILREAVETARRGAAPVCLLAGGETTVTVVGAGQGGRNQELAVSAAEALAGFPVPAAVASFGTDGIDGMSDAAGGIVDDQTTARAAALGLAPPSAFLASNDTRNFLGPLGDLIVTGPTGTNVCDVVVLLAGRPRGRRL
jgi:glycerate 2-kinase